MSENLFYTNKEQNEHLPADIKGAIEKITFRNDETGYTVAHLIPASGGDSITILGVFSSLFPGESLRCQGTWIRHPKWGLQVQVQTYESIRPATAIGIRKYLGSGMVKGIGPVMAGRIVDKFGAQSLETIENSPDLLAKVPGIGAKRVDMIRSAWIEHRDVHNVMIFLQSHGVTRDLAYRIYKFYGGEAISKIENNPYILATDLHGIGFRSADKIAKNLGFVHDDPRRLAAGLIYAMKQSVDSFGHIFLLRDELIDLSETVLGTREVGQAIDSLIDQEALSQEEMDGEIGVYLPEHLIMERKLADRIAQMASHPVDIGVSDIELIELIELIESSIDGKIALSSQQISAVALCLKSKISILTGGPGTGKTTSTLAIANSFRRLGKKILLASPTGRATKRLSEATGADAKTIHRLLSYDMSLRRFKYGSDCLLSCDVLIVDEASMLDMRLAYACVSALSENAQLVLVGDMDQLPSVGPGNTLRDMIESGKIPVAYLTEIYRQAALSTIVSNAHAINKGQTPKLPGPKEKNKDFAFVEANEPDDVPRRVLGIVAKSLPNMGFKPDDIQVLTPMQKGPGGAISLNENLQTVLNPQSPEKPEIKSGSRVFRLGDRVIQLRNNYDKGIYNGEIGEIASVDPEDHSLTVRSQGVVTRYDQGELDELSLAYCLTVHKAQGSEFPAVVVAIHTQHYALLQRNLIYTALTRAKQFAVLVGSRRAIDIAVRNDRQSTRHTRLKERLLS